MPIDWSPCAAQASTRSQTIGRNGTVVNAHRERSPHSAFLIHQPFQITNLLIRLNFSDVA
jgi:hypothetical protein